MTYYDWKNGKAPFMKITDGAGQEYDHLLNLNTETGRAERHILKEDGEVKTDKFGNLLTEIIVLALPIKCEPLNEEEAKE